MCILINPTDIGAGIHFLCIVYVSVILRLLFPTHISIQGSRGGYPAAPRHLYSVVSKVLNLMIQT